jgi:hypothetical protein
MRTVWRWFGWVAHALCERDDGGKRKKENFLALIPKESSHDRAPYRFTGHQIPFEGQRIKADYHKGVSP